MEVESRRCDDLLALIRVTHSSKLRTFQEAPMAKKTAKKAKKKTAKKSKKKASKK